MRAPLRAGFPADATVAPVPVVPQGSTEASITPGGEGLWGELVVNLLFIPRGRTNVGTEGPLCR